MWLLILISDTPWLTRAINHAISGYLYHTVKVITASFQKECFPLWRSYFWLRYSTIQRKTLCALYRRKLIRLNSTNINIEFSNFDRNCHKMLLLGGCHLVIRWIFAIYCGLSLWLLIFVEHLLHLQKWPISREVLTAQVTILRELMEFLDTKLFELMKCVLEIFFVEAVSIE